MSHERIPKIQDPMDLNLMCTQETWENPTTQRAYFIKVENRMNIKGPRYVNLYATIS